MPNQNDIQDFEELKESQPETYAQYCWTLANNAQGGKVEVGQVISCGGPCHTHGQHEYDFRLTPVSVANIDACRGLETCGEAISRISGRAEVARTPMNRAERRRAEREAAKRGQPGPVAGPTHFGQSSQILGVGMSPEFLGDAHYGLPEKASREWIVAHTDKDEALGVVPIPLAHQDGLMTHAEYVVAECSHLEPCGCNDDPDLMWELVSFSG